VPEALPSPWRFAACVQREVQWPYGGALRLPLAIVLEPVAAGSPVELLYFPRRDEVL
jgi:hypothetical protein